MGTTGLAVLAQRIYEQHWALSGSLPKLLSQPCSGSGLRVPNEAAGTLREPLFLCTWPRRLGELSASGEADPGWKGLDSGGGGPRRRSCVDANMYVIGEASVELLTLTHQPHRVIQGTPSWAEDPGGGLETCDILSKPPHALPGCRVLEPREGGNTVAVTFPPPGALGASSLQGLGCSDSNPGLPASQPSERPPPNPNF